MRFAASFFLIATFATGASPEPNHLTAQEKRAGWTLLFDGKTMAGWDDPRSKTPPGDSWAIEDGCLKATSHSKINEDLFSRTTYGDFELAFEWRISPGGNSGMKYRIQDHLFLIPKLAGAPTERFEASVERSFQNRTSIRPIQGQDYVVGFEYQITDDGTNKDSLSNAKHTAGALYDMVAPSAKVTKPVGEFNESRILVRGKHVEHWLNGVKVVDSTLDSPDALAGIAKRWKVSPHVYELLVKQPKAECQISLQNHGDVAWFRSIRIRRLQ